MSRPSKVRALFAGLGLALFAACGWDPRRPFERNSPEVDRAIVEIDAGQAEPAAERLRRYVGASTCDAGALFAPGAADATAAGFDLGLALFGIAEAFGRRFGEQAPGRDGGPDEAAKQIAALRGDQAACARAALDAMLARADLPAELEARARYLRGNLSFLEGDWDAAVKDYDRALKIIPGLPPDAGDSIGADAAWNRALALRNKQEDEKKDAGPDADADADAQPDGPDADADAGPDADADADADAPPDGPDADAPPDGPDGGKDGPEDGPQEAQSDANDSGPEGGQGDAQGDAPADGSRDDKDKPRGGDGGGPEASAPQPNAPTQDDRMLDQFEHAPTWQREEAKSKAGARRVKGMQDK